MDFHNRQYDPLLGRFMGTDPMADAAGQQGFSPYHAMACNPSTMVDPLGLAAQYSASLLMANPLPGPQGTMVEGHFVLFGGSMLGSGVSDFMRNFSKSIDEAHHEHMVLQTYYYLVAALGTDNAQNANNSLKILYCHYLHLGMLRPNKKYYFLKMKS